MYIDAILNVKSYIPRELEKGMMFVNALREGIEVYELNDGIRDWVNHSHTRVEAFLRGHGYPVELELIGISLENDLPYQLAHHEEIGWVDEGEDSEDMHEITIDDINEILRNRGYCQAQVSNSNMEIPIYDEGKVIIKIIEEEQ